jgi:hypothetical protein
MVEVVKLNQTLLAKIESKRQARAFSNTVFTLSLAKIAIF